MSWECPEWTGLRQEKDIGMDQEIVAFARSWAMRYVRTKHPHGLDEGDVENRSLESLYKYSRGKMCGRDGARPSRRCDKAGGPRSCVAVRRGRADARERVPPADATRRQGGRATLLRGRGIPCGREGRADARERVPPAWAKGRGRRGHRAELLRRVGRGYEPPTRGVRASYPWGTSLLPVGYGAPARGVDFTRAPPSVAGRGLCCLSSLPAALLNRESGRKRQRWRNPSSTTWWMSAGTA